MKTFVAATHPLEGAHLIEASAGTGKTYSITLLVLRLLVEKRLSINNILVVTYTEAATRELKDGIYNRICDALSHLALYDERSSERDEISYKTIFEKVDSEDATKRLEQALLNFDRAKIFTIHGFCQRLLTENAFETKMEFDLELTTNSNAFFSTLAKDFWLAFCYERSPLMVSYFHQQGLNVAFFETFAKTVCSKPELLLVTNEYKGNAEAQYVVAYRKAREALSESRRHIERVFDNATGINKRRYSKRNVPAWLKKTEKYFSDAMPPYVLDRNESIFRFSRQSIFSDAKESVTIEDCLFFDMIDALGVACEDMQREIEETQRIFVEYVKAAVPKRKQKEGLLFFDDLLQDVYGSLKGHGANALIRTVAKDYKVALIDEFQDTDAIQYQIFKRLFLDSQIPFFMIGDPKQAVYSFRGGDIFAYMDAAKGLTEQAVSLDTNWRSAKDLVLAVNRLFSLTRAPFLYSQIQFHPVCPKPNSENCYREEGKLTVGFQFLFCQRPPNICAPKKDGKLRQIPIGSGLHVGIATDDIVEMLEGSHFIDGKKIEPQDIAILVRTNAQAKLIRDALQMRGVAGNIDSGESVYQSVAAKELLQILYAIMEGSGGVIKTALSTVAFGVPLAWLKPSMEDSFALDFWQSFFLKLRDLYIQRGVVFMLNRLLLQEVVPGDGGLKARVLSTQHGNRYLTDFLHILELLQERFSERNIPIAQLVEQYEGLLQDETVDDHTTIRSATDENAVQIVTIHKSKGLQYPVVYLPFAFNDNAGNKKSVLLYHDPNRANKEVCDLRIPPNSQCTAFQQKEELSERMRLLYVALTRAKNVCKIVWGAFSGFHESSLAYLLHGDGGERVSMMTDDAIRSDLFSFCGDTIEFAEVRTATSEDRKRVAVSESSEIPTLQGREFAPPPFYLAKGMSFSSLVYQEGHSPVASPPKGVHENDRIYSDDTYSKDAYSIEPQLDVSSSNSQYGNSQDGDVFFKVANNFDRGTAFGNFVHEIFEQYFEEPFASEEFLSLVNATMEKYGFQKRPWAKYFFNWFQNVLDCSIDSNHSRALGTLVGKKIPEFEFLMPVSDTSPFSPQRLSESMALGADSVFLDYAHGLKTLRFSQFFGYIKGFIDLIFEHEGKYYIVDYKSNYLGDNADAYGPLLLAKNMADHHYYLQYHIYTVALHRYLQRVVEGYNYEFHFGGVYYLYVRGMSSLTNSQFGVFYDKPPKNRIVALDRLLSGLERGTTC